MKYLRICILAILLVQHSNCDIVFSDSIQMRALNTLDNATIIEAHRQISSGSEKFALDLLKQISIVVSPLGYDFIISPFSVWSLLILIAEGSAGKTYAQLQTVLGLPDDLTLIRYTYKAIQKSLLVNTSTVDLAFNQALFTDKNRPINTDFEDKLSRIYDANIVPINFHDKNGSNEVINNYVNEKTKGKISKIINLSDLDDAQMILISAIFFKGQWKFPFNKSFTKEEPFYDEFGNNLGQANMMYMKEILPYTSIPELNAHVIELPYGKENRLSMLFILPRKGVTLSSVIEKLPSFGVQRIIFELTKAMNDYEDDEIEVYLPRVSITADFTLNYVLEKMGLDDLFDATNANLSKISNHQLYLSRIMHKAKIEINEEGTVASAASAATFVNKNTPTRFYANRPFAYVIVEKTTNIVLFCGQVRNAAKVKL